MEFLPVDLQISEKVASFFHEIEKIEPNSCIAGGYLSDLYVGKEHKDVDIFIHHKNSSEILNMLRKKGCLLQSVSEEYTSFLYDEVGIYETEHEGELYQLIFTTSGAKQVESFDIRCKEMFYQNNQVFISKEAKLDHERKEVRLGAIFDITKTFTRVYKAIEKYGYHLPKNEENKLQNHFIANGIKNHLQPYFLKDASEETIKKMSDFAKELKDYKGNRETPMISKVKKWKSREEIDRFLRFEEKVNVREVLNIEDNLVLEAIKKNEEKIQNKIFAYTLEYMIKNPKTATEWRENSKDITYLYTIFRKKIKSYKDVDSNFSSEIEGLFKEIDGLSELDMRHFSGEISIDVSDKYLHRYLDIPINEYYNRSYLCFRINDDLEFNYHLKTKKVHIPVMFWLKYNHCEELLKEITELALKKISEEKGVWCYKTI